MMEIVFPGKKKVDAVTGSFRIATDQNSLSGGEGTAPEPFTYFLASIGTCAGIYIKSFCDQRQLPGESIKIQQSWTYDPQEGRLSNITLAIQVPPDFPEKYDKALIQSSKLCAVKRHLDPTLAFDVTVERMSFGS
jgi:ribosomal protein S12 methylthiotransferase accessory factor